MKMWKLPTGVNIDFIKTLRGVKGTGLAPIQDVNGDWFISDQEMNTEEFASIKDRYLDVVNQMVLIEFVRPVTTSPVKP